VDIVHANSFKRALDGTKRFVLSFRHTNQVLFLDENYTLVNVVGMCCCSSFVWVSHFLFIYLLILFRCYFHNSSFEYLF
jgi:hypothetical protein